MYKSKYLFLTIIVVFGLILRLWQLGTVPPSPDWDEAALGYDAYSIMHTGKDEFGTFMPAVLRSFDDYKPALYAYIAIPSVAIFGLTTFAVRLPSLVMGIVGIIAIYFLVIDLFENKKDKEILALVSAFVFAISPWSLQFSRTAFETNVGLTLNILIGLFFLKGLKKPWFLLLAALFAGLNLAVYQSERVFTPLLVVVMVIIYGKELFSISKKYIVLSIIVGLLAVLPTLLFIITNPTSLGRVQGTSITSQKTQPIITTIFRLKDDKDRNDLFGQLIDNRRIVYAKEIIAGYLAHFDPNWLFVKGDINRHHAPGMGLTYFVDLPFLLLGMYLLLFGAFEKRTKLFIFLWLLLAPIPASITYEVPHAVRTMNILPALLILVALGYVGMFHLLFKDKKINIKEQGFKIVLVCIFVFIALFNFIYYLNQYFVQQNYFYAVDWQYGYAQAIPQIGQMKGSYQKVVVSDRMPMDNSYMFFLFYLRYPPQQYQELVSKGQNLASNNHQFDKYEFRTFDWNTEKSQKNILFVGTIKDFPKNIKAKKTIYYPNGTPAILLVDPKDNV